MAHLHEAEESNDELECLSRWELLGSVVPELRICISACNHTAHWPADCCSLHGGILLSSQNARRWLGVGHMIMMLGYI